MKHTLRIALAASLLTIATPAFADPATEKAAGDLLDYINSVMPYEVLMQQAVAPMLAPIAKLPCGDKALPQLQTYLNGMLTYQTIRPLGVQSYSQNLTLQEITDLNAFYHTPSGVGVLKKLPQVQADMQKNAMVMVQTHMPDIKAIIQQNITPQCVQAAQQKHQ